MGKFEYERAVICFSKAITLQPQQTRLLVNQGEAYLQLCDFQSAAASYHRACFLVPGVFHTRLAFIYYLQGQCLFDRGLFLDALEAFNKAAELRPGSRAYRARSLACLTASGRHGDCLQLLNDWITESSTADLYIDLRSALELNPACPAAAVLQQQLQEASQDAARHAVNRMLRGQLHAALCLMNVALENDPQDGRLYLFRGILHRRLRDFTAAFEDLVQAVDLCKEEDEEVGEEVERGKEVIGSGGTRSDKDGSNSIKEEVHLQMVLTYNDFAVQCFTRGLYSEATVLLNKAIEEEKDQASLYLNRGDCFFRQGDWCYALADYQQAEEMLGSDDPAVRNRLAVVHNTLGSFCFQDGRFQEAVDRFSQALRYNPTASLYYENRLKALRKIQNVKGAREDFISMLILEPSSEEVPAMLMNLFPGSTESDVLSSLKGQAVRAQLKDAIKAWSCSCDRQRLTERLQMMNLTNESGASQSEDLQITAESLQEQNVYKVQNHSWSLS
ncbi:tetratricopeptide repeat protein 16-like [Xenentodon cancila]